MRDKDALLMMEGMYPEAGESIKGRGYLLDTSTNQLHLLNPQGIVKMTQGIQPVTSQGGYVYAYGGSVNSGSGAGYIIVPTPDEGTTDLNPGRTDTVEPAAPPGSPPDQTAAQQPAV